MVQYSLSVKDDSGLLVETALLYIFSYCLAKPVEVLIMTLKWCAQP